MFADFASQAPRLLPAPIDLPWKSDMLFTSPLSAFVNNTPGRSKVYFSAGHRPAGQEDGHATSHLGCCVRLRAHRVKIAQHGQRDRVVMKVQT
eukprot:686138-Rhodomonas_salina.2